MMICPVLITFGFLSGNHIFAEAVSSESVIYVSTEGRNTWSGTLDSPNGDQTNGPLKSLAAARDRVRSLRGKADADNKIFVVEILGGLYELDEPFVLSNEDGAKHSTETVYRARQGEEVHISAGKRIADWKPVTDESVLEVLKPEVRDQIWQTDLAAQGIKDFGLPGGGSKPFGQGEGDAGAELFFNDQPMQIARYPNRGFVKVTGLVDEDPVDVRGTRGDKSGKFFYEDERISQWANEKDAWVEGYWFWDWAQQRHPIAKLDADQKRIEVAPPLHTYGYRVGQWFFGLNLLCEIDIPGEYYIDREKGILYFYPPAPVEEGVAMVTCRSNLITLDKANHVTIQGLILDGSRDSGVVMQDCTDCTLSGCVIRNIGGTAVKITQGENNLVADCDIFNAGATGIVISGGDRSRLHPGGHTAMNNNIHHIARLQRVYCPGIMMNGVGNKAIKNTIAHLPHMAICFGGNDHLMEFNEIYDVCYESNDAGAIYAGRDWTQRGNMIRHNYFHDITGFEGKGCVGVYLDDMFCAADIVGNVFQNVTRAAMIGGGRDNSIVNNIFIDCEPSVHVDARALGWCAAHADGWLEEAEKKGTVSGMVIDKPPYSTRYPKLLDLLKDEPKAPKGNVIANNICVGGTWDKAAGFWNTSIEEKARPYLDMHDNIVDPNTPVDESHTKKDTLSETSDQPSSVIFADPMFVDSQNPERAEFQLKPESPALKLGFQQIPFDKIGASGFATRGINTP